MRFWVISGGKVGQYNSAKAQCTSGKERKEIKMKIVTVKVQEDHLESLSRVKKPILAIAELVWNGLDANANGSAKAYYSEI